jgi:predicted amidohydrolase
MSHAGGNGMLTRRDFVTCAAGAMLLTQGALLRAQPARYDLVIKGGRVIDPSLRLDAIRDVGIAAGRIAAIEPSLAAAAAATIDARGKLVVPGLIDIHSHAGRNMEGPALDVAILELREGEFEFVDNYENKIEGRQRLFPSETVLGGVRVPRA